MNLWAILYKVKGNRYWNLREVHRTRKQAREYKNQLQNTDDYYRYTVAKIVPEYQLKY